METDFDATNGALHGLITDKVTGAILTDTIAFLHDPKYGAYDPSVDGVFNSEAYFDSEISLLHSSDPTLTLPGLAVIDNIDSFQQHHGPAFGYGPDHGGDTTWLDGIVSNHG